MAFFSRFNLSWLLLCVAQIASAGSLSVIVVDREGKPAADAVVVLMPSSRSGGRAPGLPMQATITQEKMQFQPAVSIVGVGAKVRYINNDPWDHHIRGTPRTSSISAPGSELFELRLEGKSEGKPSKAAEVVVDKVGAQSAVLLGCFLHGSMRGHIYVSDSPWTLKTGADGMAKFDDVPNGAILVKVWHADQLIDLPSQVANVNAAAQKLQVQLQVVPRRRRI